ETPPRSRARTRLVYPTSRAAPVCPTARPTRVLGPAAAGPRSSHWTAGARQTRPACAPVRARRRAFHALSPVGARQWPASLPPRLHRRRPTGLEPGGGSCTRPLRIIILPPKPGKIPHTNLFWRGQGHGLPPFVLPTGLFC